MKYINNKIIGITMMVVVVLSCTDKYDCGLNIGEPEDVILSEHLNSFDLLKSYVSREGSPFKLGVGMSSTDFLKKDIAYSTLLNNFDAIDIAGSFNPLNVLKEDGTYDFGGMKIVADAAAQAGVTIYGGTLCSNQGQRATYYNELLQPVIIPIIPEKGKTIICNFENDAIGTHYAMTGNSSAVVEDDPDGKSGKALHVATNAEKASYSYPKIKVVLPEGRKLGDYINLTFDMRVVNTDGIYGSGVRVLINGTEFNTGKGPSALGCSSNAWNRGVIVKLNDSSAGNVLIPEDLKGLTEFELAIGSGSGGAQFFIDNIVMNYEVAATGVTTINFEKDEIGKTYPMTNGNSSVVENDPAGKSGKILHIGSTASPASYTYPQFNVKLQNGRTLGDYTGLSLDMYMIGGKGLYGSGVRVIINGTELNCGKGPAGFGCQADAWGRGIVYIKFAKAGEEESGSVVIPDELKSLTEIELAVGSGSGEAHCYIDNINLHWKADDTIIPKTPEEKKAILTEELNKWIGGIVNAGGETVRAWNVVGEPLDEVVNSNTFTWGEYLGENEYARTAVKLARDTAKVDLDLFVSSTINSNDDINSKCDKLIELVTAWEADKVTQIDGYNILLHASYSQDAKTQEVNEKLIAELFTKLGATGKKIRVSDLSMTVINADGQEVICSELSSEEKSIAADYNAFIINKYLKIIPKEKQYGISISRLTEVNGGTQICPWSSTYNRTQMYEGVVKGLKGE